VYETFLNVNYVLGFKEKWLCLFKDLAYFSLQTKMKEIYGDH